MLKFFRRIRQKLLVEGSFRKYLVYAVGEILLVVIGILIALQINNANEESKNKIQELYYMNALLEELIGDTLRYDSFIERASAQGEAAKYVYEMIDSGVLPPEDTLYFSQQIFYMLLREAVGVINNPSIWNELQTTGNLGLIRDKVLLKKLYSYYNLIEYRQNLEANPNAPQSLWVPLGRKKLSVKLTFDEIDDQFEDFKIDIPFNASSIEKILSDKEYLQIAKGIYTVMKVSAINMKTVKNRANAAIEQLEQSIEDH